MPRKPIERSNSHYYHITARSNNREFFFLPVSSVWDIMTRKLAALQSKYEIKIGAWVLMNNHFHLLVMTPNEDIDRIMYFFMKEVTLEIQRTTGRINKIFGGRYKGSLIENFGYLLNVYKYIYRNPIESGLSENAEFYPYSTLYYEFQHSVCLPFKLEIILPPNAFYDFDKIDELRWINQKFEKKEADSISWGLQKTIFAYGKDRASGKPIQPAENLGLRKSFHDAH